MFFISGCLHVKSCGRQFFLLLSNQCLPRAGWGIAQHISLGPQKTRNKLFLYDMPVLIQFPASANCCCNCSMIFRWFTIVFLIGRSWKWSSMIGQCWGQLDLPCHSTHIYIYNIYIHTYTVTFQCRKPGWRTVQIARACEELYSTVQWSLQTVLNAVNRC